MNWNEFYDIAVPQYIRDREAGKNGFVSLSRWVSSREAFVLYKLGVSGNFISILRLFLGFFGLYYFYQIHNNSIVLRGLAYQKAIRSACLTAIVFGIISPIINKITVATTVATITPRPSPNNDTITTVTNAAKATFTRLFPRRMVARSRSGS